MEPECPSGYDAVEVHHQRITDDGVAIGPPIIKQFECADGYGATSNLELTTYRVWIEVIDSDSGAVYAVSVPT
jgi:hypothetical protein